MGHGSISSIFKTTSTAVAQVNIEKVDSTSAYITAYDKGNNRTFVCQRNNTVFTKWKEMLAVDFKANSMANDSTWRSTPKLAVLTWSEYNSLAVKASDTLYVIVE